MTDLVFAFKVKGQKAGLISFFKRILVGHSITRQTHHPLEFSLCPCVDMKVCVLPVCMAWLATDTNNTHVGHGRVCLGCWGLREAALCVFSHAGKPRPC